MDNIEQVKEVETALIGACLRGGSQTFEQVRELLAASDFGVHTLGVAWEALTRLHENKYNIDVFTLGDELERMGRLSDFSSGVWSGRAFIADIRANGDPRNAISYAAKVLDYAGKRKVLEVLTRGAGWASNGRTANDTISDLLKELSDIRTFDTKSAKHTQSLKEAVSEAYDHTDAASRGEIEYVMTDYVDLDKLLGGLASPDLYIVAARPGQGKTAFLASVVMNAAKAGKRIAFFTLEMKNSQIATRFLSMESGVSFDKQKSGKLTADEWTHFNDAVGAIEDLPIHLNDLPSIKASQMRRELRRIGKVDLIVLDYIQLAGADGKYESRALEVGNVTRELKAICKEFDVPMLAAAQLSRALEQRQDKRPMLSDLKESGGLEENADVVMFIYRPDQYEKDATPNTAEIIVSKHRNGPVGMVELIYRPAVTRFENAAKRIVNFGNQRGDLPQGA